MALETSLEEVFYTLPVSLLTLYRMVGNVWNFNLSYFDVQFLIVYKMPNHFIQFHTFPVTHTHMYNKWVLDYEAVFDIYGESDYKIQ